MMSRHELPDHGLVVAELDATGPDARTGLARLVGITVCDYQGRADRPDWLPAADCTLVYDPPGGWLLLVPAQGHMLPSGWLRQGGAPVQRFTALDGATVVLDPAHRYEIRQAGARCWLWRVPVEEEAAR
ncbi:hypothetical protein [Longispora fulva]|uniref:Uncharacterized protein n=2 Tax=Longispora fulva TaxID=619741 RepID=A0A8J7GIX3_9ACTN|nr:hypothetical protein [Longispora fulva]MBG6138355.1 hypothetical protein [Longispora fulva]